MSEPFNLVSVTDIKDDAQQVSKYKRRVPRLLQVSAKLQRTKDLLDTRTNLAITCFRNMVEMINALEASVKDLRKLVRAQEVENSAQNEASEKACSKNTPHTLEYEMLFIVFCICATYGFLWLFIHSGYVVLSTT